MAIQGYGTARAALDRHAAKEAARDDESGSARFGINRRSTQAITSVGGWRLDWVRVLGSPLCACRLSLILPVIVNIIVVDIGFLLVILAALFGELTLTIAGVVISAVSILLLSPATMYGLTHNPGGAPETNPLLPLFYALLLLPLIALALNKTGRFALGRRHQSPSL